MKIAYTGKNIGITTQFSYPPSPRVPKGVTHSIVQLFFPCPSV